jgi:hypothetical protein
MKISNFFEHRIPKIKIYLKTQRRLNVANRKLGLDWIIFNVELLIFNWIQQSLIISFFE